MEYNKEVITLAQRVVCTIAYIILVLVLKISFAAPTSWSAWVKKTSNAGYAAFISATEGGRDYVLRNDVSGTKFDFVWAYSGEGWGDVISPSAYPINQRFNVLEIGRA